MCRKFVHDKKTRELVDFAKGLGFEAILGRGGHLKFSRPGCMPIFTSSTPGDHRAWLNAKSNLKRSVKNLQHANGV